jgi:hypothetical protein
MTARISLIPGKRAVYDRAYSYIAPSSADGP